MAAKFFLGARIQVENIFSWTVNCVKLLKGFTNMLRMQRELDIILNVLNFFHKQNSNLSTNKPNLFWYQIT